MGLAGVAGNGQRELADIITGQRFSTGGHVAIHGENISNRPVKEFLAHGVSHIPEDRSHVGTAPNLSVTDNLIMKQYDKPPIANGWFI